MSTKDLKLRVSLLVLLLGMVAAVPAFAGSAVIGSVAGSMNATVGGQTLVPNTTLFSGDSLQVKDGVAVVAVGNTSRMVFGRDTMASFLRDTNGVTILLGQGNVSMFHPDDSMALRVKVGEVSIAPAAGFKTLGEVAMLNGAVIVTAKEGMLRIEGNGSTINVAKGKTITLTPTVEKKAGAATGGSGAAKVSTSTALEATSVATGVTSTVVSGVAMSRAGSAKDAANTAATTAQSAVTAANSAATAASSAAATAVAAGCALDTIYPIVNGASPFTPPSGTC